MTDLQPGDRVEYQFNSNAPGGSRVHNGRTGTVVDLIPVSGVGGYQANVDWDEDSRKPYDIQPWTDNLQRLGPPFKKGDRIRHKITGEHGTVVDPAYFGADRTRLTQVDWDGPLTSRMPKIEYLEPLVASVTHIEARMTGQVVTTEYETDSHHDGTATGYDPVNHPSHYKQGGLEAINVLEAFGLVRDGRLFNVGKYVLRAGKKDGKELEDLKKARWYLDRYITEAEGNN